MCREETTTKKRKTKKIKKVKKTDMLRSSSKNLGNLLVSPEEKAAAEGFTKRKVLNL